MCFVIASVAKQSGGLMQMSLKFFSHKLTDWFCETPIHCVRNDIILFLYIIKSYFTFKTTAPKGGIVKAIE